MNKKKVTGLSNLSGLVYSTDPNFKIEEEKTVEETIAPAEQNLKVIYETKGRGGKAVSIVYGFKGNINDIETLGKTLKQYCGTGGSVKDGEIIIQGDQRDKIINFLLKQGYTKTKKAGG